MISRMMQRIKQQMEKHHPSFLNPPATMDAIEAAEREIGVEFPDDVKTLYLTHNGETSAGPGLFFGLSFLSIEGILSQWRHLTKLSEDAKLQKIESSSVPKLWVRDQYFNHKWIPIGTDYAGNYLGIDLAPNVNGKRGQIISFGRNTAIKYVIAYNIKEWLAFILQTIKNEMYTFGKEGTLSYGPDREQHFFDALSTIELPVFHAEPFEKQVDASEEWFIQLDNSWKEMIENSGQKPKQFLQEKVLYLADKNITDVSPLAVCKEVRSLVLSNNQITDLTPLQTLPVLESLHINKNPIINIEPLANIKGLQSIYFSDTQVKDLRALASLYKLRKITMENIPAVNFDVLPKLKGLTALSVSVMNIEQLIAITDNRSLRELHIHQLTGVSDVDLSLLAKLKDLTTLTIEHAVFDNLNFLNRNQSLRYLTLTNGLVKDASAIANLVNLTYLKLNNTSVGNIEVIANAPSLNFFEGEIDQMNILDKLMAEEMIEDKLLDVEEKRNYFIYSTNGHINFPLIDQSLESMQKRMYDEVKMGYTNLLLLKRKAIYLEGKWVQLAESVDETVEKPTKTKDQYYFTFLFLKINPSMHNVMYTPIDGAKSHLSFDAASKYIENLVAEKQTLYPNRNFFAVYAQLLDNYMWH